MTAEQIILNIAVNMGRLGRFAMEGKRGRVDQFLEDTESYIELLRSATISSKYQSTHRLFLAKFQQLKTATIRDEVWAEDAYTFANILTHRAKLA